MHHSCPDECFAFNFGGEDKISFGETLGVTLRLKDEGGCSNFYQVRIFQNNLFSNILQSLFLLTSHTRTSMKV